MPVLHVINRDTWPEIAPIVPCTPRVGIAPAAAAPIANGPGRVGAVMDDQGGSTRMMISGEEAAELIPLEQYVSLGYPRLGMIGTIRPELESRDVAEWRSSSSEMETGGPTFVRGEIDVLEVTRALDHRIPLPIGHLLSISEQANEHMMQHCKANRKRFALARANEQKAKAPPSEEKADVAPDPIRLAMNVTFQNFVNKTRLIQGMINFCVIVYMDDILVYSDTFHGHVQHIEWTLGALRDAGFKIALEKSEFFLPEISFLGYVVTRGGLRPNSQKVAVVKEAPVPTSLTQVRAFLGLASYYRRFIKGFAVVARPLTNLLRKEQPLHCDDECDQAFGALKDALVTAPILIRPDPFRQFILITDWQPEAISVILAQKGNDGKEHVIEYASRTVPDERRNDSAPQGECYAVVWGIQHFHPYLYGQKFLLVTDHEPLLALKKLTNYTGMIGQWAVRLQEYEFDIVHRKTQRHDNAGRLTRLHRPGKVHHPRLSPDLQRVAQLFCSRGVYAAAEIHVDGRADAIILAEAVKLRQRTSVDDGRIMVVVNFSGDLTAIPPIRHTRIKAMLLLWAHNLQNERTQILAHQGSPYEDEVEEIIREELTEESSEEEEENLNEDEGEPAQQQEGDEDELLQTESEEEAEEEEDNEQGSGDDNDEEQANEDPQLQIAPVADLPISNDPTLDPEPPQPDDGHVAQVAGPSARRPPFPPRRPRRSRSPSASLSLAARPPLRARRDEADRSSSSGSLSPPP
ncbi:hypothetical protein CBR_g23653 [Chara braunii]|uniref:Reverse transcriptase domain-containing protein n=1 Tax=Chara braunii TaxID=69332 RepID=A0A388L552_CHABU|nr:hypothetical protein CBR_g23653 [Chara braunii]|eukprot:GBG77323.1 hypothetical protein CBR_g23653 [Chara braunii]